MLGKRNVTVEDSRDARSAVGLATLGVAPDALRAVAELLPDALLVADVEGRILVANAAAARVFGRPTDELVGVDARRVFPDGFFTAGDRAVARRAAREGGGAPPTRTLRMSRRDGSTGVVEGTVAAAYGTGATIHYVGVFRDVGGRQRAEDALRRSEASFRTLIENIPDGIAVHRDGRFVYVNPAFRAMLGVPDARTLLGRPWLDVVHPEERIDAEARLFQQRQSGKVLGAREMRLVGLDGAAVWTECGSVPVVHDGEPAIALVARDITERRHMQMALYQADRLTSVGTLAAGVAHEINNPLTYVITNLGFLAGELKALGAEPGDAPFAARVAEMQQALVDAREGAERVRVIVQDLKTFSRSDEHRRGPVDVRTVLESSVNMAWNEIRHRARLVKDYRAVRMVDGNEARLGQVFLNLLVNAAQAIPEGAAASNQIRITTRDDGERVVVEVADTGVGIAPEARGRLFDPFFTTKPIGVGTGLGLAVSMGIVRGLGGSIEVDSEIGGGSTFRVLLPALDEVEDEDEPTWPRIDDVPVVGGRVLVIDDEPGVAAAVERALRHEHEVVAATDARAALRRLADREHFDVILCDLMMPEMTGMDFHAAAARLVPGVLPRVVYLTGGAFTPRARAFLDTIPNARVDKPFEEDALRRLVRARVQAR